MIEEKCEDCGAAIVLKESGCAPWCGPCLVPLVEAARERFCVMSWKSAGGWMGVVFVGHPETGERLRFETVRATRQQAEFYALARLLRHERRHGMTFGLALPAPYSEKPIEAEVAHG